MRSLIIIGFHLIALNVLAQTSPNGDSISSDQVTPKLMKDEEKSIPEDRVLPNISLKDHFLKKSIEESRKILENPSAPIKENHKTEPQQEMISEVDSISPPSIDEVHVISAAPQFPSYEDQNDVRIFKRNLRYVPGNEIPKTITLPSGSSALATLLSGVEISSEEKSIDVRLDYAFLGPNKAIVELTGCIAWVKLSGDYSTERLFGKAYSISCRSPNGKTFDLPIMAHVKDERDEYLGIKGKLIANGKLAAAALSFLRDGTTAFGEAMAKSQTNTEVVGGGISGTTATGTNVSGNKDSYIIGQTAAGASGKFLNWWVDYYTKLSPTIAVPPGTKIYLSVEGEVQIPEIFFVNNQSSTRINTNDSIKLQHKELP
ncbi:MAG: hypothetical protein JNM93_00485 [Bacteriovoracaceae bacterium]|nr:hypothetical protein [Bacteriovoracaceae bacterium]